jgi:uncharacterized membrane protein YoaK (UPF0700 family)
VRHLPPERIRDGLLVLLAVTTGATDATAFERLGHVFASVITGNLVLLGISAVQPDGRLALFSGVALAGYGAGVLIAAPRRRVPEAKDPPVWPAGATLALAGDLAVLIVFGVFWEIVGGHPARGAQIGLLVLCAMAMGMQSTAVRRMGPISTTYLTSTLTGLLEAVISRRWVPEHGRSVGILLAAVAGAAAGLAVDSHAPGWLPAVQLIPLAVVVLVARRSARWREPRSSACA